MTPERWKQAEDLFNRALDEPVTTREAWLAKECAGDDEMRREVAGLLASDAQTKSNLAGSVKSAVLSLEATPPARFVGPYELLRELGRGGMGTVYLGKRTDEVYDKDVAIKLVTPGMDTDFLLARFKRERQVLASLEHPNIARLLDGGTAQTGEPYFVMEYIPGVPITQFCQEKQLSVADRLRLFLPVCAAVTYAHSRFVVHRDLKPGNILVEENGTPRLLDFGICKLLLANPMEAAETMTQGMGMMTPDYASPEQVRGEPVTVASDTYSLGAVLYELLTGTRPHKIGKYTPIELERSICETPTVRASAVRPELRGDIDNILMRAMAKDPARRYGTVEQFAEDIRRHLDNRPVVAAPDSVWYRSRKFVERHHRLVLATAVTVLVLAVGLLYAERQRRLAEQRLQDVRQLVNRFVFDVHDTVRELPGSTKARKLIVSTALEYLERLSADAKGDPSLARDLAAGWLRIGDVQGWVLGSNMGDTEGAMRSYVRARELADAGGATATAIEAIRHRGDVAAYTGKLSVAQEHFDEAARRARAALEAGGDRQLLSHLAGAELASSRNQRLLDNVDASLVSARKAATVFASLAAVEPGKLEWRMSQASAASGVGMALARKGQLAEARDEYLSSVKALQQALAQEPNSSRTKRELMLAWSHVGDVEGSPTSSSMGNRTKALAAYAEMKRIAEELLAADNEDQRALGDLGIARMRVAAVTDGPVRLDRFREALATIGKAVEKNPKNLTMRMNLAYTQWQYGIALKEERRTAEAMANWREAAVNARSILSTQQGTVARLLMEALGRMAITMRESGQDTAAIEAEIEATAQREKPGTMSGGVNRAKGALIGLEIALVGRPLPQAELEKRVATVKVAWDQVRGKPGWQPTFERDYLRFVELVKRRGVRIE
jgi:serine/threonine protein kinase/tetratricopeptide (TPR) repeat protein